MAANGLAVCTFSVAVNERKRQQDGTYQDETNWFDCVVFGKRAEGLQPYLARGTKLSIVGHLKQKTFEQEGQRRSRVEIIVDEVELMNTHRRQQGQADPPPRTVEAAIVYGDEIPF